MKILLLILLYGINPAWAKPIDIFVSILPQQYLLEQIGGQHIQVHLMVKAGYSPATYDPLPQQLKTLNHTSLYFSVGHLGFEQTFLKKVQHLNPDLKIINTDQNIQLLKMNETETQSKQPNHDHHHIYDPHVWLDPILALTMAKMMTTELSLYDPSHASDYQQAYQQLAQRLTQLDQHISQQLAAFKNKRFMVFHPAWGYFAKRYHLEQIALVNIGKTPGPQTLIKIVKQAQQEQIKIIFVQKQFSTHMAKTVAKSIQGQVISVDSLAYNYIENLKKVTAIFVKTYQAN